MGPILQIDHLTRHYPSFTLDDVSFAVEPGSIMGLIGENGAGKSTTLKLILGLIRCDSGTITLFGQQRQEAGCALHEDIGVVFDDSAFHDHLSPVDVDRILRGIYHRWDSRRFLDLLDRLQVPRGRIVKEMSRGMRMKLSLAAALSHEARLLILDEATSGLDPIVRNELLDLFWEFVQDGERSVLISSHITSDLERVADYITFLHAGRVVFSRTKDELLEQFALLRCPNDQFGAIDPADLVGYRTGAFATEALVRDREQAARRYPGLQLEPTDLETIMLYHVKGDAAQ